MRSRLFCLVVKRVTSSPRILLLMLFLRFNAGSFMHSPNGSKKWFSRKTYCVCCWITHRRFVRAVRSTYSAIRSENPVMHPRHANISNMLHAHCPLPVESILHTTDVTAPYPSIPHDDGLSNVRNAFLVNSIPTSTINGICDMTELVLRRNVFVFSKKYFI